MVFRIPNFYLLVSLVFLTAFYYYGHAAPGIDEPQQPAPEHSLASAPANATLGFGGIYAVSGHGSPRRDRLLQAANVSELILDIPEIPDWTQERVDQWRDASNIAKSVIRDGSIKAWLSHALALNEFLASGKETALIIEDDVDWDIRLRTAQVPRVAAAQRSLLPKTHKRHYWGHPDDWDLLYLGHCGDYFTSTEDGGQVGVGLVHPSNLTDIPHAFFQDPTLPDPTDIHPFTSALLTAFNTPPKTRLIHKSKWPLCTFGYAVTRQAAVRLLSELAPPREEPGKWTTAFDIAILEACRDANLRCTTVNPELFHHMQGTSLIDGKPKDAKAKPPVDRVGDMQVLYRGETSNIGCGFWSKDFYFDGDMQRLEYLRQEVGRKGLCLKPGREVDGSRAVDVEFARRMRFQA